MVFPQFPSTSTKEEKDYLDLPVEFELKKSHLLRLEADFIDHVDSNEEFASQKYKFLCFRYNKEMEFKASYEKTSSKFKCYYITIDSNKISLFGFMEKYGHEVYVRPNDIIGYK